MTDQDSNRNKLPLRKRDQLTLALRNLLGEYGRAPPLAATAINTACIVLGVAVWHYTSGPPSLAGMALAAVSAIAIIKWAVKA